MRTEDEALEAFFAAGRGGPAPSEALMARILDDAEAELAGTEVPRPALAAAAPPAIAGRSRLAVFGALGWQAVAGMATAAVAGLWLGFYAPDAVNTTLASGSAWTVADLMPSLDLGSGL